MQQGGEQLLTQFLPKTNFSTWGLLLFTQILEMVAKYYNHTTVIERHQSVIMNDAHMQEYSKVHASKAVHIVIVPTLGMGRHSHLLRQKLILLSEAYWL